MPGTGSIRMIQLPEQFTNTVLLWRDSDDPVLQTRGLNQECDQEIQFFRLRLDLTDDQSRFLIQIRCNSSRSRGSVCPMFCTNIFYHQ